MTLSRPASPASTPDAASAGGTGNRPASAVDSADSASAVDRTGARRVSTVDGACLAATPVRSLWHDSEFVRFWLSQTTSMAGSQISFLALPLVAVLVLGAGAMQTGALTASSRLPFLVFGLLVGVWVDRFRRRPMIIWAYLGRAVVLAWIPVAAGLHVLTVEQIYVVAFAVGTLTLLSDVAAQSFLPTIADEAHIIEANSKLEVSRASTDMVGPSAGGALVQALTAPLAILADVVSYLVATALLVSVRVTERKPTGNTARASTIGEIREGLRFVLGNRLLRWNALASALSNLFTNILLAILVLYAVRSLRLSPGTIGLVIGVGSVGALLGAASGRRMTRRWGLGPTLIASTGITGSGALLISLAHGSHQTRLAWVALAYPLFTFGYPAFNVAVISLRQVLSPGHLLGRTNATMRFLAWGTMPIGAFLGGILGNWTGLRTTMITAGVGLLLPPALLLLSPLRRIRSDVHSG